MMVHGLRAHGLRLGSVYIKFLCSITGQDNKVVTCSPEEQQRWLHAAFWKGGSINAIGFYPTIMTYSVLKQSDFEATG
jgi:hypothetical protein